MGEQEYNERVTRSSNDYSTELIFPLPKTESERGFSVEAQPDFFVGRLTLSTIATLKSNESKQRVDLTHLINGFAAALDESEASISIFYPRIEHSTEVSGSTSFCVSEAIFRNHQKIIDYLKTRYENGESLPIEFMGFERR